MKKLIVFLFLITVSCSSDVTLNSNENSMNNKILETELILEINGKTIKAELVDNSSTRALVEHLLKGEITINMHDYGNFEKVGEIGTTLPRNDENITTEPCDLILYLGSRFVIYYDTNTWDFTRLGKIKGISQSELKQILGNGNVNVTLKL